MGMITYKFYELIVSPFSLLQFNATLAVEVVEDPDFVIGCKGACRTHTALLSGYTFINVFFKTEYVFTCFLCALVKCRAYGAYAFCFQFLNLLGPLIFRHFI